MDKYEYVPGKLPAQPLCKGIDSTLVQLITSKQYSALKEQKRWLSIIEELGDNEAYHHTGAVKVVEKKYGKVLVVYVPNSICKVEFEHRKPLYLALIQKRYQTSWVCDIEFCISRSWQRKLLQSQPVVQEQNQSVNLDSVVLSEGEEHAIDKVVRTYITSELQSSVKKLLRTYKKLEKSGNKG